MTVFWIAFAIAFLFFMWGGLQSGGPLRLRYAFYREAGRPGQAVTVAIVGSIATAIGSAVCAGIVAGLASLF